MKVRVRLKSKILKNLGSRVKELRNKQGITQEELAYLAGVDSSYIGGIEIGRRSPSIYCLYSIAVALKVKLSQIVDFDI
jgi:DNA-binding protein